ncbi:MAG TPA: response regulator [Chloroflexota bacterium]|jgi:DNA-binding response OmpR family regulator|nr:response regulator [Chloroflexota bacterium]
MARILLASDDAMVSSRVGVRQTLEAAGHVVYETHDGPSTLAQVEALVPDLLVLDTALPILDGFHVLAELRRNPRFQRLPVVMFSGLPRGLGSELARPYGVAYFLARPFRTADIAAAVEYVLALQRGEAPASQPRPVPLAEAGAPPAGEVVELPPNRGRGEGVDRRRHRA